jgi:malate dehydrogenase
MSDLAILGAGELGGLLAHAAARRQAVRSIELIDEHARVAEGKALDISQAAPIEAFATRVAGSSDVSRAAGASVIAICDRFGRGEWDGEEALALLRGLRDTAPRAIVVCAGASQRELVERAVRELHMARLRVFGSAPEALAAGARALVGLMLRTSPSDVALTVLGVPPHRLVIPWHDASAGGLALIDALQEPARRELATRVAASWPPGPYALAAAAARTVDAVAGLSRRPAACFVAPDDSNGRTARTAAYPVRLGPSGIVRVEIPTMNAHDRVLFENATAL